MELEKEKVVETKTCKICSTSFEVTDEDLVFYDKVSPIFASKKYSVPTPTLCPDCRRQRRLSWRNESKLYRNKDSLTDKDIVSVYSPEKPYTIYEQDLWWSDRWDPLKYGRDFDFTRPFFPQFAELQRVVPRISLLNGMQENADYGNHSYHNKNSYLVNSCGYVEDSHYCVNVAFSNNCVDCYNTEYSSQGYELIDCRNCELCFYLLYCKDCYKSVLCEDCVSCKNCIGCKGLHHKEYHILNKPVTREKFEEVYAQIFANKAKWNSYKEEFEKLKKTIPSKGETNINCTETIASDNCTNSKHLKYCFECHDSENLAYCFWMAAGGAKDCYDFDIFGEKASLVYETHCSGISPANILFSNIIWGGHHNLYCDLLLTESANCFGCVGFAGKKEYCILNKQYSKEEYEILAPKIISHMQTTGEWGEFFPSQMSFFGYNESVAQEWFPLTKEEALSKGFVWSDYEAPIPKVEKIIPASKLPANIADIPDDILNWAVECEVTKKPFRIIRQELEFYRKYSLSVPTKHPEERHTQRLARRNPRKLWERKCDKCAKSIRTTYSPTREEKVYCESCYHKEIY